MVGGEALEELWKRCPPEIKLQVEETARKRYQPSDPDVEMADAESHALSDEEQPTSPSLTCGLMPFTIVEESVCGVGGARELRRRLRRFSMSTLKNGSGSVGRWVSASSLMGDAGLDGVVKVTCGREGCFEGEVGCSSSERAWLSASAISTSGSDG